MATILGTLIENRKAAGWDENLCHSNKDEHQEAMGIICAGNSSAVIDYLKQSGATEL